jgi:nicotinic acid phosphoribosyltransferase
MIITFTDEELAYLQSTQLFQDDEFFQLLRDFRFKGDMYPID